MRIEDPKWTIIPPRICEPHDSLQAKSEQKFAHCSKPKKPNPDKKKPEKYSLDHEVIMDTVMPHNCEHKTPCLTYFSAYEIVQIRKRFCYQVSVHTSLLFSCLA